MGKPNVSPIEETNTPAKPQENNQVLEGVNVVDIAKEVRERGQKTHLRAVEASKNLGNDGRKELQKIMQNQKPTETEYYLDMMATYGELMTDEELIKFSATVEAAAAEALKKGSKAVVFKPETVPFVWKTKHSIITGGFVVAVLSAFGVALHKRNSAASSAA